MNLSMSFQTIWTSVEEFKVARPQRRFCKFAEEFNAWAEELCQNVEEEPDVVRINQAKVQLVDKYYDWYSVVSKKHRHRIGTKGHLCIFHVFIASYERLRQAELALTPPLLFLPAIPPPVQIPALFLGELDESGGEGG